MSSAHFDLEQSLLDSLAYDKTDPDALINDSQHNAYFNLQGMATTNPSDLAGFPSFFASPGSLGLSDPSNFNGVTPQLDQDQTPASMDSVSLSPRSPLQTAANFFNQSFAYANPLNGQSTSVDDPSSLANGSEKRKASVAAPALAADAKKIAKLLKPPTGKKPGRKADNSEPASKKKAQNRAAQRAFRERKEKHLKDLEDRVSELEAESHATSSENDFLRQQVSRLQTELKKYRASRGSKSSIASGSTTTTTTTTNVGASPNSQFTFEFPFFQRSQSGPSGSTSYVKSSVRSDSEKSSPASLLSPTSGIGSVSSASSSQSPETAKSCASQSDPGEENFCENLNLACGTRENPIPQAGAKGETPLLISALQGGNEFPHLPATSLSAIKPANPIDVISPPMFELDFLSDYRDPIFDSEDFSLPDLTTENSLFDPLAPPHLLNGVSPTTAPELDDEETVPASSNNLMSCTAVWDRISAHPKFGDLDIDGLCAELRTKAKCSETGVVLSENDVNSVLKTLNT